jgi:hypothetical protein
VTTDGTGQKTTDAGNRVELTWNDRRLNVNDNWDDNRNGNLWVSSVRHFLLASEAPREHGVPAVTHPGRT